MDFTCCRCGLERNPSDGERITVVKLPCDTLMLTIACRKKIIGDLFVFVVSVVQTLLVVMFWMKLNDYNIS